MIEQLRSTIRDVPDFPKKGIVFKDITPVLADPALFRGAVDELAAPFRSHGITKVVGIESRGFLFAAPLAIALGAGLAIVRKPGKLPWRCTREEYALEYGKNTLEIHKDAVGEGHRVIIADDLLATGGTARAVVDLVERLGGIVAGLAFVVELTALKGRDRFPGYKISSLLKYED